jgi:hypothetical protein
MTGYQFDGKDFIRMKDHEGNRIACTVNKLKDPNQINGEELKYCVADQTAAKQKNYWKIAL